ncbi:MAG: hypothetical protein Q8K59_10185 [Nitrosomonas sp.]|nr:hypothetical protein [Nitrosomonas sp.]MDP1951442.1 hypothetical protein [Nitrosomonas sp.]
MIEWRDCHIKSITVVMGAVPGIPVPMVSVGAGGMGMVVLYPRVG